MGKGDRRTPRGKTYRGSYGNTRPHRAKTAPVTKAVSKTARKTAARKRSS
jgi:30S ribosomal protein S31